MTEPLWLNSRDIYAIQGEILAESGGASGILDKGAIESTLSRPKNLYYYGDDVTLYQLAASLGYGLVKNHLMELSLMSLKLMQQVYFLIWLRVLKLRKKI